MTTAAAVGRFQTPAYLTTRIVEPGRQWYDVEAGHMRHVPPGQLHVRCEACPWWTAVDEARRPEAEALRVEHLERHHWIDLTTGRVGINPPEDADEILAAAADPLAALAAGRAIPIEVVRAEVARRADATLGALLDATAEAQGRRPAPRSRRPKHARKAAAR